MEHLAISRGLLDFALFNTRSSFRTLENFTGVSFMILLFLHMSVTMHHSGGLVSQHASHRVAGSTHPTGMLPCGKEILNPGVLWFFISFFTLVYAKLEAILQPRESQEI